MTVDGPARRGFASDNASGAHPAVLEAIVSANVGHVHAYGDDPWTREAIGLIKKHFGETAEPFFVFNGTGANITGLQALVRPFEAVICPRTAHINSDECGAFERFVGSKLIDLPAPDGKLTPALIEGAVTGVGDQHHVQPRAISITQSTEYGTVYDRDELAGVIAAARALDLRVHVDGARLANAAASLGCTLGEACAGADVVSFGATKNGAALAECVVFLDPSLAVDFRFVRKQGAQLSSKMRFVAAQYAALLQGDLWLRNAAHANAMARLLAEKAGALPGVQITHPVEANEIFAILPHDAIVPLQAEFDFYTWDERLGEVRWVTSWDTTPEDVERFVDGMASRLGA